MTEIVCVMEDKGCLPPGTVLRLSEAQLKGRQQHVRLLPGAWFITLVPVWFEQGEVITLMGPLEPAWAAPFTPPELRKPVVSHPNHRPRKIKAQA